MNAEVGPIDNGRRPDSPAHRIDAACDRFEAAWRAGQEPKIEDFLVGADPTDRPALLRELLALELELRRGQGEHLTPDAYHHRFPGQGDLIDSAFAAAGTGQGTGQTWQSRSLADAGRNLLFGLLALQNNFISRESLLAAFAAWVADKSRPLARILLDLGALDVGRHALLEALVAEHLKLHGDSPERSLASLSSIGSVRDELERINDTDLHASLAGTGACQGGSNGNGRAAGATSSSRRSGERFRILRFHREGGLGRVYVARDEELGREVALKEIRPDKVAEADLRGRFMMEAEINGGLEHPGIVPVYSLGTYDDGRPFYAMRFVEGDSLKEAIESYHREHPRPDPSAIEFRRLLGRFVDVCEAIAFAHSKGVLHRDLKPHNVMLGRYGETLLIDWGLAKATGRREPAGVEDAVEATLVPPSGSGHAPTVGVLGSPSYMSPEQAAGAREAFGPATDVYGLGAILFALLTGEPPVEGETTEEVLDRVRRGAIRSPRSLNPNIPRSLEAVCLKALATESKDRYATALALAEDVEHWLADEPVSAHAEPMRDRARRWMKQHRTVVAGATAAGVVMVAALVAITAVISFWNRRLETTNQMLASANQTISQNNNQITRQNQELEESNKSLKQARAEAEKERDQAGEVTEFLVSSFRKPDPEQDGRDVKAADVLGRAVKELEGRERMAPATKAEILSAVGKTYLGLGRAAEAVSAFQQALALRRKEFGEDHRETLETMNNLGVAYEKADQPDRAIPLHEQVLKVRRIRLGDDDIDTLATMNNLAADYMGARQSDRAIPLLEQALNGRRARLGADHPETLASINNLANAYNDSGQFGRAIPLHEQSLKTRRATLGADHPYTLRSMNNLAMDYYWTGQFDRAIPLLEQALNGRRAKLGADHPETLLSMNTLALAYRSVGRLDRAIPLHEQAFEATRAKLGDDHTYTISSMGNLALDYVDAGQLDRAIPLQEQALRRLRARWGDDHLSTLTTMDNLASSLAQRGRFDRAIPLHEKVLMVQRAKQGDDHPKTLHFQARLARAYEKTGRDRDAERLYRKTVEAARRQNPRNESFYSDLLVMLGRCLFHQGRHTGAVSMLREGLEIKERTRPGDWTTAQARSLLGEALAGQMEFPAAEPLLLDAQKALTTQRERIRPLERDATLREAAERLVHLYEAWGKKDQAEEWRKKLGDNPLDRGFPADPFAR